MQANEPEPEQPIDSVDVDWKLSYFVRGQTEEELLTFSQFVRLILLALMQTPRVCWSLLTNPKTLDDWWRVVIVLFALLLFGGISLLALFISR